MFWLSYCDLSEVVSKFWPVRYVGRFATHLRYPFWLMVVRVLHKIGGASVISAEREWHYYGSSDESSAPRSVFVRQTPEFECPSW
jgi:hypothetical protein